MKHLSIYLLLASISFIFGTGCSKGCRGATSEDPPLHPIRNMYTQDKGKTQRENTFFTDGRVMRPLISGTISQDTPDTLTDPYITGRIADAATRPQGGAEASGTTSSVLDAGFVQQVPVAVTMDLLKRGQERYHIYCAPCHGESGYGNGTVVTQAQKGGLSWAVSSYHDDRLRNRQETPDGRIFDVITHGIRTMPSYASQIPIADRWAIVAYIRALQRSQQATLSDVPLEERSRLK